MFKNYIQNTKMTSPEANMYFEGRIEGCGFKNIDVTFLSTLRALLANRVPKGRCVSLEFGVSSYDGVAIANSGVETAVKYINSVVPDKDATDYIYVHSFESDEQSSNLAWMELVKSEFEKHTDGWGIVEKVTLFFKKSFYAICFINPDKRATVIFTEKMDYRKMHYLQAGIPAFMPWYFSQEDGLSDIEMSLIQSLRLKTSQEYTECIDSIAEQFDFKTARIRRLLDGFETRYESQNIETLRAHISSVTDDIVSLNRRISDKLKQKRDFDAQLLGLEMSAERNGGESEIMEYFLCNKHLSLDDVDGTTMRFVAKDYLTYFDEELARSCIENKSSYIYCVPGRDRDEYFLDNDVKMLMEAIFLEQKLRIRFCAAYSFDAIGNVEAIGRYNYGCDSEFREYMPNPHIDRYSCLGNYYGAINECLSGRNYIGAIEQSIASCKSLNLGDAPVMRDFMKRFYGIDGYSSLQRYIELPNGSVVTTSGAIEYLKGDADNG